MPLDEAVNRVMAGEFRDAKTCLGLLMAARVLADQPRLPRWGDGMPPNRRMAGFPVAQG